jgi:ElaB/YqjD/DUF883 family membrane-anchored ribosome-binding protein
MIIYSERSAAKMDFKETRVKQIETALKTTRERFRSLAENDFKEIEDFKVQAVADAMNLLDNYFESLKNDEDPEVEKLRKEYNKLLESIDEHEHI